MSIDNEPLMSDPDVSCPHPLSSLIKGHFMTLGVVNWLKKQVAPRKLTVSHDHIYTGTIDSCRGCQSTRCEELASMCEAIRTAFAKVTEINKTNAAHA